MSKINRSLDTDTLVYTTKCFENHQTSVFDEFIQTSYQEEIIEYDDLTLS